MSVTAYKAYRHRFGHKLSQILAQLKSIFCRKPSVLKTKTKLKLFLKNFEEVCGDQKFAVSIRYSPHTTYQKMRTMPFGERKLIIMFYFSGDKDQNKQACLMILSKVVEDPQSGTCLNVSYADVSGPVANYNPTGSPFAQQNAGSAFNASTASLNSGLSSVSQSIVLNGGLNLSLNLQTPGQSVGSLTAQLLDNIKVGSC